MYRVGECVCMYVCVYKQMREFEWMNEWKNDWMKERKKEIKRHRVTFTTISFDDDVWHISGSLITFCCQLDWILKFKLFQVHPRDHHNSPNIHYHHFHNRHRHHQHRTTQHNTEDDRHITIIIFDPTSTFKLCAYVFLIVSYFSEN